MDYKDWKMPKGELENRQQEYTQVAEWCNTNGYHIEDQGEYYVVVINPPAPEPTIQDQIEALEAQITDRNIRASILGDEFAINKITQIEAQIAELRQQLEESQQ